MMRLHCWTHSVGFVSHELPLCEATVLMGAELLKRLILPPPRGWAVNIWEGVRLEGIPKVWWVWVHACVWGIMTLFEDWGVPSRASFSPGASIQNSFFSNSFYSQDPPPHLHNSSIWLQLSPKASGENGPDTRQRVSTPKWRPGWTGEQNKKGDVAKKINTGLAFLEHTWGGFSPGKFK